MIPVIVHQFLALTVEFAAVHPGLLEASKWLGALAGCAGSLAVLWKWVIHPTVKHARRVGTLLVDIEGVVQDLQPNSGTSLRDAVMRIEGRLIVMERVQQAVFQDGDVGVFQCDADGRNTYVNRTYCRKIGASKDQMMAFGWRSFISPEERDNYDDEWQPAFMEGREVFLPLKFRNPKTQRTVETEMTIYPITDRQSKVVQFLGIVRFMNA